MLHFFPLDNITSAPKLHGRGVQKLIIVATEMLSLNIRLCIAFLELGMWQLVLSRVGDARELVEMGEERYRVTEEVRGWLVQDGLRWRGSRWGLIVVVMW